MVNVYGVDVLSWNPIRENATGRVGNVNNFGDLLGPVLVRKLLQTRALGLSLLAPAMQAEVRGTLLTVGSIVHFASDGDTIWGSGVNGKIGLAHHRFSDLDVRAVRGPLSGRWLVKNKGIDDPEVYGDPALLLLDAMPHLFELSQQKNSKLAVIPNFHDFDALRTLPDVINPRGSVVDVLTRLVQSEQIATSSLHGLVVGELLGIPTALFMPSKESLFKYEDYILGTGRRKLLCHATVDDALKALRINSGFHEHPLAAWNPDPLRRSFPSDLWGLGAG
ncbi:polysaccharide pyruvyl transferase family protein [Paenarthrobacter sp. NPDC090522]|uniref:polysaccharide pyruvyl transferase family protein n=1 Tax=Paenarthrobacter sp. NPDC090522 TaxID=3364383 RepID=UPI003810CE77